MERTSEKNIREILNLALHVCLADEVLSEVEEQSIVKQITDNFENIDESSLNNLIDVFFTSEVFVEGLVDSLKNAGYLKKALRIAYNAAEADGLDVRENITFLRVLRSCNYILEDIFDV